MSVFRGVYSFSEIEICIGSRFSVFSDTNAECMDHLPTLAIKMGAIAEKQNANGCFQKIWVPQNRWFILENPIKIDNLEGKPTIFGNIQYSKGFKWSYRYSFPF